MSRPLHPAYRFETAAQWGSCLFAGADRGGRGGPDGLRPFGPYAAEPGEFATPGAWAPAIADAGEILWRDGKGRLQRLPYGDQQPRAVEAPRAIASATRLIATPGTLWAAVQDCGLEAFDPASLARLLTVELPGLKVIDITGDARDGLYALAGAEGLRSIVHLDCAGNCTGGFALDQVPDASALVYLGRPARLVVLGAGGSRLFWFDPETGRCVAEVALANLRPCFAPTALGSDGCGRLFLAGTDGAAFDGRHQVVIADAEGALLGTVALQQQPPTGVTADRTHLYVATGAGLLRFAPAAAVPRGASEVKASVLTPLLRSPAETAQNWVRVEAEAVLPAGCTIEITFGSPLDGETRDRVLRGLADPKVPLHQRLAGWRRELAPRTYTFHGGEAEAEGEKAVFSAPLHDVREAELWVMITLIASPGGRIPSLSALRVLYPGPTLLEHLPAIYRRGELEAGDFLRGLVGVLEASTQSLDARIGALGRNIHPETADGAWLDFIAEWLGLPWDDALSLDQKRCIAGNAATIAGGYGTRAGLEALLAGLMPETPRRFRIVDMTAEFGLATVGGEAEGGSRLPALLAGLPATAAELGNKAVLGRARLTCAEPETASERFLGRIRIDIAATAAEQQAWSPWLDALIQGLLPATVRAELNWRGTLALPGADGLGDDTRLDDAPQAHLGSDAVTGLARLAGRSAATLPGQLSNDHRLP